MKAKRRNATTQKNLAAVKQNQQVDTRKRKSINEMQYSDRGRLIRSCDYLSRQRKTAKVPGVQIVYFHLEVGKDCCFRCRRSGCESTQKRMGNLFWIWILLLLWPLGVGGDALRDQKQRKCATALPKRWWLCLHLHWAGTWSIYEVLNLLYWLLVMRGLFYTANCFLVYLLCVCVCVHGFWRVLCLHHICVCP